MTSFEIMRSWTNALMAGTLVAALAQGALAQSGQPVPAGAAVRVVPVQASPGAEIEPKPQLDSRSDLPSMTVEVAARPVVLTRGKAEWSDGFKVIVESIAKVDQAIRSAGLTRAGRPFTVFLETDEEGFQFEAMIPIAEKPRGQAALPEGVEVGTSPAGKAIKFQHRGPYEEIESTYNLITTFLDEKGLEAQNLFIEEYLSDTKDPADVGLEADIYVFLK